MAKTSNPHQSLFRELTMNNDLELLPINGSLRGKFIEGSEKFEDKAAASRTNKLPILPMNTELYYKNMQNEPNLQNAQMSITTVAIKDYMKNDAFAPPKNEPNTNPILPKIAYFLASGTAGGCLAPTPAVGVFYLTAKRQATNKKMQNEPNFKNDQKIVTSFTTMVCDNFCPIQRRKNEPNLSRRPVHRSLSPAKMEPNLVRHSLGEGGFPQRNTTYAIRYTKYEPNSPSAIRNTQYAIRYTKYEPNSPTRYEIRNTRYEKQTQFPQRDTQYAIRNTKYKLQMHYNRGFVSTFY